MAKKQSSAIVNPNLGLYLDRSVLDIPAGALQDGLSFRIQQGKLNNINLGWSTFAPFTLNGAVTLITTLHLRTGTDILIFGTPSDLYKYSTAGGGSVTYITPTYVTGTASASGTAVTGTGTLWNTGTPTNAKAGDEISFGSAAQNSPSATWYTIQTVNSDTSITLTATAGVVGGGAYTIRKKFTGTAATVWQVDTFVNAQPSSEDRIYFTNGIEPPCQWNGSNTAATSITSLGLSCKTLVVYKNMLIMANLIQDGAIKPTDIVNSDVSMPESLVTGLAAQFKIAGTSDEILKVAKLGDYLVIYLKRTIIVANFVGSPLIFVFRVAADGKGIQATRGLATYPDYHEYLGADTMYKFDGSSAAPVSNHVWREVVRILDPARSGNVFTVLDEHRGDYIWATPLTTDSGAGTATSPPSVAFAEHYLEEVGQNPRPHSRRSFPFTSSGYYQRQSTLTWDQLTLAWTSYNFKWNDQFFAASFSQILVGDANGKVWTLNDSQNANGAALPSYVTFGRRPTVEGQNRALLARIFPFVTPFNNTLTITAMFADFAVGTPTITATATYDQTLPEGLFFTPIYRAGRYVDLRFGTDGPSAPYEISGYDWLTRPGGMR